MEYLVIAFFSMTLLITMLLKLPLLLALVLGYVVFFLYGLHKKCNASSLFLASLEHCKNIGNLLLLFCLIGILTATWRASGTIAFLVVNSTAILVPSLFIVSTFLLCTCISMLTGTSFGTSATMGVICMTMGNVLGVDTAHLGGAILSGSYFGDRMSPMSSSAHLTAKITHTNIFVNIKNMFRTCLFPFFIACVLYFLLGRESSGNHVPYDTFHIFTDSFNLSWPTAIPAILIVVLACCKVHAKNIMLLSIFSASALCLFLQNMSVKQLLHAYWEGFTTQDTALQTILGGGGLQSMLTVSCIVTLSSSYVGLFQESNFFKNMHKHIASLAEKTNAFSSTAIVAVFTCMLTCNQTLSIFLTKSLCENQYQSRENLALAIENSAVVIAGLIPWNIACSVVLANVGAPLTSIWYAFFLYLVPLASLWYLKKENI